MILKTEPFEHQIEGFEKLSSVRVGAFAMEMGTGKTRTTLQLVDKRLKEGKINTVRWYCPCAVKTNLAVDIMKHVKAEYLDIFKIYGIESLSQSDRLYDYLLKNTKENEMAVGDESSLIKNHQAKRTARLTRIAQIARYRNILNGTLITKSEKDLFSQYYFLDKRILGYESYWSFAMNHLEYDDKGRIVRSLNTNYLTRKIAPFTFQKLKNECLDLPPKNYINKWFLLGYEQEEHYEEVVDDFCELVDNYDPETFYRMVTAAQLITSGRRITSPARLPIKHCRMFNNPENNPRIDMLMYVLSRLSDKVIIWTKYLFEADEIAEVLAMEYGIDTYRRFNGEMTLKARNQSVAGFKQKKNIRFLIISKGCGQFGLNLQFCHNEVFYSNDFDFGTRTQAEDRIHRIGQSEECQIIDLWASGTVDNMICTNLSRKSNLLDDFRHAIGSYKLKNLMMGGDLHDLSWTGQSGETEGAETVPN